MSGIGPDSLWGWVKVLAALLLGLLLMPFVLVWRGLVKLFSGRR